MGEGQQSLRTVLSERSRTRGSAARPDGEILIAGGSHDPNILALIEAATARSIPILPLLVGEAAHPSLAWNLDDEVLRIDGESPGLTAAFVRRDVFHDGTPGAGYRAATWYTTLQGWLASSPRIRTLNRRYLGRHTNKLHLLRMARDMGLRVPETVVTNAVGDLAASGGAGEMIAKPVPGGGYCMPVEDLLAGTELRDGVAATPAIVQRRLSGPDLRIYRIGRRYAGFRIRSEMLDYRMARGASTIEPLDSLPDSLIERLGMLMDAMGLDWGAADFKIGAEGEEEPVFLEVNSDPMFSVFDRIGKGAITGAMFEMLLEP